MAMVSSPMLPIVIYSLTAQSAAVACHRAFGITRITEDVLVCCVNLGAK